MHLSNLQYLNNQINTNQKKQDRVFLSSPHMSDKGYEMQFIKEAFDTNWIAPLGENVDEFEKELANKVGIKSAAALSSGTAAIHMALKAAGVEKGDIVFCRVSGRYVTHLIHAIRGKQYQIGNNRGYMNGWVTREKIFGKVVKVWDN